MIDTIAVLGALKHFGTLITNIQEDITAIKNTLERLEQTSNIFDSDSESEDETSSSEDSDTSVVSAPF